MKKWMNYSGENEKLVGDTIGHDRIERERKCVILGLDVGGQTKQTL